MQCVCGRVHSHFQHEAGQGPEVHGGEGAMHSDQRPRRALQQQGIRWNAKEVTCAAAWGFMSGGRVCTDGRRLIAGHGTKASAKRRVRASGFSAPRPRLEENLPLGWRSQRTHIPRWDRLPGARDDPDA
jgi:hypothetical protein